MKLDTIRILWVMVLCSLGGGCADLQIKVYSYTGDETYGGDAQLASAVGQAAHANQSAREFLDRLNGKNPSSNKDSPTSYMTEWQQVADSVQALVDEYEKTEQIETLEKDLDAAQSDPAKYAAARRQLAVALVRYSEMCLATGQRIGIPAEIRPFWLLFETGRQCVLAGVALEQDGEKIQRLAGNMLDQDQYTPTASIFKSLQFGFVAGTLPGQNYAAINESSNWKLENTQYFSGSGDLNDVVVKDDVGNWVQKSFSNDPTGVIDATFNGAGLVVDTLASAYGVSLPKTTGNATSSGSTTDDASADEPNAAVQAAQAKKASAQLVRLQAELKSTLQQVTKGQNGASEQDAIVAAVELYQAQVSAIGQPYSPPPASSKPAPASK